MEWVADGVLALGLLGGIAGCDFSGRSGSAAMTPELLAAIRAGAATVDEFADTAVIALRGDPLLPLVDVYLNGSGPYPVLLDFASNVSLLRQDVARAAGATVLLDRPSSDIARLEELRLGRVRFQDVTVGVYDDLDVAGVIGWNLLRHFVVDFDPPSRQLRLHHPTRGPANTEPQELALLIRDRMPVVMTPVGDTVIPLHLDTGASESMTVPESLAARLPWLEAPTTGRTVSNNQTGAVRVTEGVLRPSVQVGTLRCDRVRVYVNPDAEDAWIGMGLMRHARWILNPARGTLRVEVISDRGAPTECAGS